MFDPIEVIGYAGSLLILVSMTRSSILQLRVIGLVGSLAFVVYGVLISAYPIAIVNLAIVGVHLFFLRQLLARNDEYFTSLELTKESAYLRHFLDFHAADIARHQPGFVFEPRDDQLRAFVLRDTMPAGVFIGRSWPDGSVEVELDYVVPAYRDFKVAQYLYSDRSGVFGEAKRRRIWTRPGSDVHVRYFERLGFRPTTVNGGRALATDLDEMLRD